MLAAGVAAVVTGVQNRIRESVHTGLVAVVDVAEQRTHRHAVEMSVVDAGVEGEVVDVLDHPEGEAVPHGRRRRRGEHVVMDLFGVHETLCGRNEFDVRGIDDGAPDDVAGVDLEGAVIRALAADVVVDRRRHGGGIADPGHRPGGDQQPRHADSPCRAVLGVPEVLCLLVRRGDRIVRGVAHERSTGHRGPPGGDLPGGGIPRIDVSEYTHCAGSSSCDEPNVGSAGVSCRACAHWARSAGCDGCAHCAHTVGAVAAAGRATAL